MLPLDSKAMKHFCKTQANMYYPTSGSMSDFYRSWQLLKGINIHQRTAALCGNDRVEPGTTDVKVLAGPNYCCSGQLRLQGCRSVLACAGLNRHPGVVLPYISSHWFSAGSAESTHKERCVPHLWTVHPVYTVTQNDDFQMEIKTDRSERRPCSFLVCAESFAEWAAGDKACLSKLK